MKKITTSLIFIAILSSNLFAQEAFSKKEEKLLTQKGEAYYNDEYYSTAATIFERLNKANPKDLYYELMIGICYTFLNDKKEESLAYLLDVRKKNPEYSEVNFFIGRAYAVNHQFDNAIKYFNKYLNTPDLLTEERDKAKLFIANCKNAKTIVPDSLELVIENIGLPINTKYEEYVPIITPDERILIFTYRGEKSIGGRMDRAGNSDPKGEYYEDIMISYKSGDEWSSPRSIGSNINSSKHDASIAISASGNKLFTYRSSNKNAGDIYLSELKKGAWTTPSVLNSEINSESWEGSASLSSDEKTLYFTSERPGGYGGRDIYKAELKSNGDWGNVQNLGPTINTRYDEDAPFIHPDGRTLYFSSKGHNSIGGYDIFYTYLDDGVWDAPSNIGYPVNTIEDDRYYVLTADGSRGYYSSAGKEDSYGGNDIYVVSPGHFGKRPILALVVGVTRADGKAAKADIVATDAETGEFASSTVSDDQSGQFMISLIPGKKYRIAIEIEGAKTTYEYIDVESVETFVQVNHNINLYTNETPKKERKELEAQKENEPSLQDKLNEQILRVKEFASDSIEYSKIDLNQRISKLEKFNRDVREASKKEDLASGGLEPANSKEIAGLSFKVELGAFKDTNDFQLIELSKYGKISRKLYDDGFYRYTFGPFETLEFAENFRDMLIEKEPQAADAFITVFVFGQRKTVDEFTEEYTLDGLVPNTSLNQEVEISKPKEAVAMVTPTKVEVSSSEEKEDNESNSEVSSIIDTELATITPTKNDVREEKEEVEIPTESASLIEEGSTEVEIVNNTKQETIAQIQPKEDLTSIDTENESTIPTDEEIKAKKLELMKDPCDKYTLEAFTAFILKDIKEEENYDRLLKLVGPICHPDLHFEVQIGAYRKPNNFKYAHLLAFGDPQIRNYGDAITRFTQGEFKTFSDAEVLRQQIIKKGTKDAWITPFYKGKRLLMQDLVKGTYENALGLN